MAAASPRLTLVQTGQFPEPARRDVPLGSPIVLLVASPLTRELEREALGQGVLECLDISEVDASSLHRALERADARAAVRPPADNGRLFRAVFRHAAEALIVAGDDLIIRFANEGLCRMLGHRAQDMTGRLLTEYATPEGAVELLGSIQEALARPGEVIFSVAALRHADGTGRRVSGTVLNLLNDPEVQALVVSFRETSNRDHESWEAQESERQFRALAEHVPVLVWMDDANHNLIYQNPFADRFSGRTIDQESGRAWFEGIHPDDVAGLRVLYEDTVARPTFYQRMLRLRRADGVYRWVLEIGVPRLASDGALLGFIGVDVDVTELKEASVRLEEAGTRYRHFIEQSSEGIWRFELESPMPVSLAEQEQIVIFLDHSYLAECNVAMAAMYGYDRPEEMVGKRLREFVAPDVAGMEEFLRQFIRSGYRLTGGESHEQDRRGRSKLFLNNLVGVIEDGSLVRCWGMQQDITERRQLEEETRQVRKMETAGRLAGGIAHDFNNLLTAILGTTEILLNELPQGAAARSDVEEIKRAAGRAANLTRQLLAFSRRQVLQPRVLDLNQLAQGVETMLRRLIGEHINLITRTDPALWRVRADPGQLEQVLLNLCVNARDAMPTGGTLTIETSNIDFAGVSHGPEAIMPAGRYVLVKVTDTGVGMEPETLRHVFEPFFTTKEQGKGTGLGLATVYGIVKQSGGFIYADSRVEEGSRFRIYLPGVEGTVDAPDSPEPEPAPARAVGTILLVEDEDAVRRLIRRVLEGVGYRVLEASRGTEALELADSWEGSIDLVITDVIMPGMSGQELSARLRARRPWLKILYVSGYTDDAILQHGTLLPNTSFLQKPFAPGSLAMRVREIVGH